MDATTAELSLHSARRPFSQSLLVALALIAAIAAAYWPVFSAQYIWDDDQYVTENLVLRSPSGVFDVWKPRTTPQYYPLVFVTFWCEYRLWGLNALGYHSVNIALHAASAGLLYLALRRLRVPGAALAAALFALHPVQVESVAWITERKNVLSLFFYLAAFHRWLYAMPDGARDARPRWGAYAGMIFFFVCALLSKTVTCSLPAAILLVEWWRGRLSVRTALLMAPMFAIGLLLAYVTVVTERDHVGAGALDFGLSGLDRVVLAARAACFYLGKLAWPADLIFIYPRWAISARELGQWVFPAAALAVLGALWAMRERIGCGAFVVALLYCGTLVPALGFVDVYPMRYSWVADHFQYHATLAPLALVACGVELLRRRLRSPLQNGPQPPSAAVFLDESDDRKGSKRVLQRAVMNPAQWALAAGVGLVLLALIVRTNLQTRQYKDARTLWERTVAANPDAWMAHHNLASYLVEEGKLEEARAHVQRSLELFPKQGEGLCLLAQLALRAERPEEAVSHCERAIALGGGVSEVFTNLSSAYLVLGKYAKAETAARQAVSLKPNSAAALSNLGSALLFRGQVAQALPPLQRSVELDAQSVETQVMLATALGGLGRCNEALPHLDAAERLSPGDLDAAAIRIRCLIDLGRKDEARARLRELQKVAADSPVVRQLADELR
ncbi:MAG: tetratricopeptide repeat protein [Planctomycetes bacterium]|nr:tetratricopeptide repeat protein [Planctomycetota bacterium]